MSDFAIYRAFSLQNRSQRFVACLAFTIFVNFILMGSVHAKTDRPKSDRPEAIRPLDIGAPLPSFQLKDFVGKPIATDDLKKDLVIVYFFGTECPIAKFYSIRLQKELDQHRDLSIDLVAINSNQQDSIRDLIRYAKENKLSFPLLKDPGNEIADAFGAERTPQVFVFDKQRKLRYRGAIDDQYTYGLQRPNIENRYLKDAVASLLGGKKIKTPVTDPVGCLIGRKMAPKKNAKVTFSNQISRILQDNCMSCHRTGEIGPFSLEDYDEVTGWAEMIREVVNEKRMPPWHANPDHGKFSNDASLTEEEIRLINQWVDAGAPQGDPRNLPEAKVYAEGWQIGKPDQEFWMSEEPFEVPADGVVDYKHYVVDPGFKEDKWIKAAECRMGNRAVVHHIIVAAKPPRRWRGKISAEEQKQLEKSIVHSEWITATAPGSPPLILPDGYAKLVPAGSKLIFQMHYTPNGTPQKDRSKVGFIFAKPEEVKKIVGTQQVINEKFIDHQLAIPPNDSNFEMKARFRVRKDALILSLFPHMHVRGKSFTYLAKYPDGREETLLDIPRYDFNWQNGYLYEKPKEIPKGTIIECTAHYDNSEENLANPDATRAVTWGDQTWDEMMIGYFDMAWK